jgi:hypothetical protein
MSATPRGVPFQPAAVHAINGGARRSLRRNVHETLHERGANHSAMMKLCILKETATGIVHHREFLTLGKPLKTGI